MRFPISPYARIPLMSVVRNRGRRRLSRRRSVPALRKWRDPCECWWNLLGLCGTNFDLPLHTRASVPAATGIPRCGPAHHWLLL